MRSEGSSVQQALTAEAALVLKDSLNLAKRRGHAHATTLHVAATLLSSTREATSIFRRACLESHHIHSNYNPLHCRALELCFSAALNRLSFSPPTSSGPIIPPHPTLSNALIAALKRAQTHQKRGCIEQHQQQGVAATQVELEQLIISILDDPSVSRVMKEAGFSSTYVKNNIEDFPSSSPSFLGAHKDIASHATFWRTQQNPSFFPLQNDDLRLVVEALIGKNRGRRNAVIVGDTVSYAERLVVELMKKVESGEVPEELRSAQFVRFQLFSVHLKFMSKSDVDLKISDLRRKLSSLASSRRGIIIYLGDLKWTIDEETKKEFLKEEYKALVDHVIAEVGRLQPEKLGCYNNSLRSRTYFMATASYQTYMRMRCQMKQPSIEVQWDLQLVSVPANGLGLSLHPPSIDKSSQVTALPNYSKDKKEPKHSSSAPEQNKLTSGTVYCSSKFSAWIRQPHKQQEHQDDVLIELKRKWDELCQGFQYNNCSRPDSCSMNYINTVSLAGSVPRDNGGETGYLSPLRRKRLCKWQKEDQTTDLDCNVSSMDFKYRIAEQDVRTTLTLATGHMPNTPLPRNTTEYLIQQNCARI